MIKEGTDSRQGSDRALAPRRRIKIRGDSEEPPHAFTAAQRLLILDIWERSAASAAEFAPLIGLSTHTLYAWRRRFEAQGPVGLTDRPRGTARGSRLPESTQRAIVMLKRTHPDWGIERLHDTLLRSEGFAASPGAIRRVLLESGYEIQAEPTRPHAEPRAQSFKRARANQLWQSDLFSFVLKREGRRLYMVVFLDDHSRFVVGHGVYATSAGPLVSEVLEAAMRNFGAPQEVLTDRGPQYHTWRGKSRFRKLLDKRGIRHLLSRPRHPQTLGKTERFWKTLWHECLESAIFTDLEDARRRIAHYIDHYNFQRTHQGIEGLVPADRFFSAAAEVRKTLEARVAQNALDLARHGMPRQSVYLTGRVGDEGISLHGEGGKLVLTTSAGSRQEVDLTAGGRRAEPVSEPSPAPSHDPEGAA
jgi:transposase InsO family protein